MYWEIVSNRFEDWKGAHQLGIEVQIFLKKSVFALWGKSESKSSIEPIIMDEIEIADVCFVAPRELFVFKKFQKQINFIKNNHE